MSFEHTKISIQTDSGKLEVGALVHAKFTYLAVSASTHGFGNFVISHVNSGLKVVNVEFDRAIIAVERMLRLIMAFNDLGITSESTNEDFSAVLSRDKTFQCLDGLTLNQFMMCLVHLSDPLEDETSNHIHEQVEELCAELEGKVCE